MFKIMGFMVGMIVCILVAVDDGREEGFKQAQALYIECSMIKVGMTAIDDCVTNMSVSDRSLIYKKMQSVKN